jgi:hypothetical protein
MYRLITLKRDTVYLDTSLTIKNEYRFNYLRKDNFGLLPFANEGQTYNTLQYSLKKYQPFPEFGFDAKRIAELRPDDIRYYSVATPITEIYYKTVMQQGQSLDAFLTANVTPRFNFSIAYRGLRSLGNYINQLSSTGNFRATASYITKTKRYFANAHFVSQDFLNGENGGIKNVEDFESGNSDYENRARIDVYFRDAKSFFRGKRLFLDHSFRVNTKDSENNLHIIHQVNYENKFFEFNQLTVQTTVGTNTDFQRFGASYVPSAINDQTHYNRLYNKVGAVYENKTLGKFQFFVEDFRYNFFFSRILVLNGVVNPGLLSDKIQTVGGQYDYRKGKWQASILMSNSITDQSLSTIDGNVKYTFNERNVISFGYQRMNKLPDHLYNLNQSSYIGYNWVHDFNNEKINNITVNANTQWVNVSAQISSFRDQLYFSNDDTTGITQVITPKQYEKTINYVSVKASREFSWWKLSLDNTILFQQADQEDNILNVPKIVTRNTLYFSNHFFKKALYLQTGVMLNYFTKYYANDYNPVIGEFFVQQQTKIGDFPLIDFFLNARIRQTRLFFKVEHLNAKFSGNDYLTAPNYPYRDMLIRFGFEWDFFK